MNVSAGSVQNFGFPVRASVRKPRLARLLNGQVRLLPLGEGNMPDTD